MKKIFVLVSATFTCLLMAQCSTSGIPDPKSAKAEVFFQKGHTFEPLVGYIIDAVWTPDGKKIVSCGNTNIIVWDVKTGRELLNWESGLFISSISISIDGKHALCNIYERDTGKTKVFRLSDGKEVTDTINYKDDDEQDIKASDDRKIIRFSPDKNYFLVASDDSDIITIWDTNKGKEIQRLTGGGSLMYDYVRDLSYSKDGKSINAEFVFWNRENTSYYTRTHTKVYDAKSGTQIESQVEQEQNDNVDDKDGVSIVSDDGTKLAILAPHDTEYAQWVIKDNITKKELLVIDSDYMFTCYFGHDSNILAVKNSYDYTVDIWDISKPKKMLTLSHSTTSNWISLDFSLDDKQILTSTLGGGIIEIWDTKTGNLIKSFPGYGHSAFTPSGKQIISGGPGGIFYILDASNGAEIVRFVSFKDDEWFCMTPDGYYTASPKGDRFLKVQVGDKVYSIDNYRTKYNRPDIVAQRLK